MKKSITFLSTLSFLSLFIVGCENQPTHPIHPQVSRQQVVVPTNEKKPALNEKKEVSITIPDKQVPTLQKHEVSVKKATTVQTSDNYQIVSKEYQEGNVSIRFPQLTGMMDKSKQEKINLLIRKDALFYTNQYRKEKLTLNYSISLQSLNFISIEYQGEAHSTTRPYPSSVFYTTNIDIEHGERVKLNDLFVIDGTFIKSLKESNPLDEEGLMKVNKAQATAIQKYVSQISDKDWLHALSNADVVTPSENPYGIYSYLTEDALVLNIQVPHVIGDHAELTFSSGEVTTKRMIH